jgi:hypothetical protein
METRILSRFTPHGETQLSPATKILVERQLPKRGDLICGVLEFVGTEGDVSTYDVKGSKCIWIVLTDCNGTIVSATQYTCIPGNTLHVTGCHGFDCDCNDPISKIPL